MKKQLTDVEKARRERRKKIRRRRLKILAVFIICIAIVTFVILLKTKLFPVKGVSAKGSSLYAESQIVNASGITGKTPILGFSDSTVKNRITKKLPYIETVDIKRKFPDSVVIRVSDASEYYAFKSGKSYYAVSEKGKVLNKYNSPPEGLIEVLSDDTELKIGNSIKFKNDQAKEIFDFLTSYPKEKGIAVNLIDISNSIYITMRVEGRFEVNLGNKENLKEKIDHLAGMIPEIGGRKGKINLDMWSNSDSKGTFIEEN